MKTQIRQLFVHSRQKTFSQSYETVPKEENPCNPCLPLSESNQGNLGGHSYSTGECQVAICYRKRPKNYIICNKYEFLPLICLNPPIPLANHILLVYIEPRVLSLMATTSPVVLTFTPPRNHLTYNYLGARAIICSTYGDGSEGKNTHLVWKLCKTNLARLTPYHSVCPLVRGKQKNNERATREYILVRVTLCQGDTNGTRQQSDNKTEKFFNFAPK